MWKTTTREFSVWEEVHEKCLHNHLLFLMNGEFFILFMISTLSRIISFRFCITPVLQTPRRLSFGRLHTLQSEELLLNNKYGISWRKMSAFNPPSFYITAKEEELFSTLRQIMKDEKLDTVIRVAGGWVRDRVLGYQGKNDIDLALDNMVGTKLADIIVTWHERRGLPSLNYHVVKLNPEKSKHLETATMKINGFDVDFVNLRSESYSEDSRVPSMTFGSPLDDALRRDLTINSLFYNINTNEVEDLTGKGIKDLNEGIIRTPLSAMQTLLDDPLRAFRAVRFASRFHFKMDPELEAAIQHPDVRSKLLHIVSRERISQEVTQMLSHHSSSTEATILLYRLDMLPIVLPLPLDEPENLIISSERQLENEKSGTTFEFDKFVPHMYHLNGVNLYLMTKAFLDPDSYSNRDISHYKSVYGVDFNSLESTCAVRYAALLDHGRDILYKYQLPQKKKPTFKEISLSSFTCMHKLFLGKRMTDSVCLLQQGADSLSKQLKLSDFTQSFQHGSTMSDGIIVPTYGPFDRLSLGLHLREWGSEFQAILLLSCAKLSMESFCQRIQSSTLLNAFLADESGMTIREVSHHLSLAFLQRRYYSSTDCDTADCLKRSTKLESFLSEVISNENSLLQCWLEESIQEGANAGWHVMEAMTALKLEDEWCRPPLVTGKELKNDILTNIPPGPIFNQIVMKQIRFELCNPTASLSELAEYLKSQYPDYA